MGFGYVSSQWMGRVMFGLFAVILDIWAIAMWVAEARRLLGRSTSPETFIEQEL